MKNSNNITTEEFSRLPSFDWDKAKHFYYVVKLGSISEAGKFLNISQPSLSTKIKILEDRLNCKLLIRFPKGIELTRKGQELFEIIERTFIELKGFSYNAAVTADNGQKRKIRIATTHALAAYVFNDLILDYSKDHPNLIFELIGEDYSIDTILNDIDIAIRPIDIRIRGIPTEKGIQKEYLFSSKKRLYASAHYLEQYGEPKTVEDLKHHRLVGVAQPEKHPFADVNWILKLGMPEGKLHEPVFTSNSVECLIDAAKKGIGIVGGYREMKIIRESKLKNILPNIKDKEIEDYIIYPNYLKEDKIIIDLKNYLKETLPRNLVASF